MKLSSRFGRYVALAFYYAFVAKIPNALGGLACRRWLCRRIFAEMGREVHIAENVYFGTGANIVARDHASFGKNMKIYGSAPIELGVHCIIGPDVTLVTGDHRVKLDARGNRWIMNSQRGIVIGDYTFVCANVTVTGGVTVGPSALVAAGAVVTNDVDEGWMYGGIPAKRIRELEEYQPGRDVNYLQG